MRTTTSVPVVVRCLFGAAVLWTVPSEVIAQCGCGYPSLIQQTAPPDVEVVFSGTVVERQGRGDVFRLIFDVDRVWTGTAAKRAVVYRPIPVTRSGSVGITHMELFQPGERYVMLAHSVTAAERSQYAILEADIDPLAIPMCADGSRPIAVAESELEGLGPGRAPQRVSRQSMQSPTGRHAHMRRSAVVAVNLLP